MKHVHITSKLASAFCGRPMVLGAVVLLPKGYDENPTRRYPVVYTVGHYSDRPPSGFTFSGRDKRQSAQARARRRSARLHGAQPEEARA